MDVLILGAGMMGRAIAYDLQQHSHFHSIYVGDSDKKTRESAHHLIRKKKVTVVPLDVNKKKDVKKRFNDVDVAISALPYRYNYEMAKIAVETHTHFIDLGGNNTIVQQERSLYKKAQKNGVTIIPDSGLAPGLVSIITRDIVDHMDNVKSVKLRVGGLPIHPKPPFNYQIVFSPYGLINEYVEDAMILDHGKILLKKSMTDVETLKFPPPFGTMEAFLTSGGCSTLPYTYKKKIEYLDYKTIRYPGHCEKINTLLELGLANQTPLPLKNCRVSPRDIFAHLLTTIIPTSGDDVILLKAIGAGKKDNKNCTRKYMMIDYCDKKHNISAMMRTTGFPVSITAQMIEQNIITSPGVFCPEEIIPPQPFFTELKKREITITIHERYENV